MQKGKVAVSSKDKDDRDAAAARAAGAAAAKAAADRFAAWKSPVVPVKEQEKSSLELFDESEEDECARAGPVIHLSDSDGSDSDYHSSQDDDHDAGGFVVANHSSSSDREPSEDECVSTDDESCLEEVVTRPPLKRPRVEGRLVPRRLFDHYEAARWCSGNYFQILPRNCKHMAFGFCDICSEYKEFDVDSFIPYTHASRVAPSSE